MSHVKLFEEYGPYRVEANGSPNFSDVVWDMLERSGVSAEEFGKRLGRLTRANKKPYTKSRVYQMLRNNEFPTDNERRWVIATLLRIPAFLLGVKTLDELLPKEQIRVLKKTDTQRQQILFDMAEYRGTLQTLWQQNRTDTISNLTDEVEERISALGKEVLYGGKSGNEKRQLFILLCGYHMLRANIGSDQRDFDSAIEHLNKAYVVAKERKLVELEGACLLRRGWALKERGEEKGMEHDFDAALIDFTHATNDFMLAFKEAKKLPGAMHGSLLLSIGKLDADIAKSPQEFHTAIKKIEEAEGFVGKSVNDEDIHFIQLNEERYYLDRAAVYLAPSNPLACYPRDARRELRHAIAVAPTPLPKRRQAYNLVLEARSHYIEGEALMCRKRVQAAEDSYEEAVKTANEALIIVSSINSKVNLYRIASLYQGLKTTDYGKKSIDVAELEVSLTTSQRREI